MPSTIPNRVYVISPATGEPQVGFFKARLVKGGPYVPIKVSTIEDRDPETGDLLSDVKYVLEVGGREVPDWYERYPTGLVGEAVTLQEYSFTLEALAWDKANLGIREREPIDLRKLPPILPPGAKA